MTLRASLDALKALPHNPSNADIAALMEMASHDADAQPWDWADLRTFLVQKCAIKEREAAPMILRAKITAYLGSFPYTPGELIPLWLKASGFRLNFEGVFFQGSAERDDAYVVNRINEWCATYAGSQRTPLYSPSLIRGAFENFKTDDRERAVREVYARVRHDPSADREELVRLARHLTLADPMSSFSHDELCRATEVTLANFIFRVKNHLRGVWKHSCHLMPIFHGPQGSSKTTAITALLEPVKDVTSWTNFEVFGHDAKEYELTIMPIMFFDEMSGASKADISKIKQVMTQERRTVRQLYHGTVSRTVITSFIGASNKDISTLVRDETGQRRFIQINTPKIDRSDMMSRFDMRAVWRSIDENAAEPPQYADRETTHLITRVIEGQRFKGPVQEWIESDQIPDQSMEYKEVFAQFYHPWVEAHSPHEARFATAQAMKAELKRLIDAGDAPNLVHTRPNGYDHFRFLNAAQPRVTATPIYLQPRSL